MYDLPGGDTGREWVEVTNSGTTVVDLTAYRFFEAETNHKLIIVSGGATLAPGMSAIIADNAAKFKTDWPAYSGILFESAFSLSNTGEMIAIKNASSTTEDSVSYTSSMGAAGDSGSLQRQGNTFISALPTPGVFPGTVTPVPKAQQAPIVKKTPSAVAEKSTPTSNFSSPKHTSLKEVSPKPVYVDYPWLWFVALAGVIVLGVLGVVFVPKTAQKAPETNTISPEFELE